MPPIDENKIQEKLKELNDQDPNRAWVVADGYNAITALNIQAGNLVFSPNVGIPIKVFANNQTGEIKIFDVRAFANPQQ